jgi:hypothetical protein
MPGSGFGAVPEGGEPGVVGAGALSGGCGEAPPGGGVADSGGAVPGGAGAAPGGPEGGAAPGAPEAPPPGAADCACATAAILKQRPRINEAVSDLDVSECFMGGVLSIPRGTPYSPGVALKSPAQREGVSAGSHTPCGRRPVPTECARRMRMHVRMGRAHARGKRARVTHPLSLTSRQAPRPAQFLQCLPQPDPRPAIRRRRQHDRRGNGSARP